MSNTQSHLIVKEEGICIYRVPDGSEFAENFQDGSGTGRYDEQGYQEAVKQAQSSAILCEDQERASNLIWKSHFPNTIPWEWKEAAKELLEIGSIYPVPGIEFQIIYKQVDDCTDECEDGCMCYHDEARARLIEHTAGGISGSKQMTIPTPSGLHGSLPPQ